jgi:plasmid stabilization system protein ParE
VILLIGKSPNFHEDVVRQFEWYFDKAGKQLAWRFFTAVDSTLLKLSRQPDLGRLRRFKSPSLHGLRSFRVESPFNQLLIFYRAQAKELVAERLMHGSRDLPRRLVEPPGA